MEAMMTHIQTMEEAMVSVLMEAIMKQSAVVDATILIVVDGPRGRRWAGRNQLRDAYLDGSLTSIPDESEVVVDPTVTNILATPSGSRIISHDDDDTDDPDGEDDFQVVAAPKEYSTDSALSTTDSYAEVKLEREEPVEASSQDHKGRAVGINNVCGTANIHVRLADQEFMNEYENAYVCVTDKNRDRRKDTVGLNWI